MTGSQEIAKLSEVIDSIIADKHPDALSDELVTLLENPEERDEAVDLLIKRIEFNREDL